MANTKAGNNVIRVDTTATFTSARRIHSIKYIGATSGTAVITDDNSNNVWEASGASNVYDPSVNIDTNSGGVTVTVSNSAVVYLYLR